MREKVRRFFNRLKELLNKGRLAVCRVCRALGAMLAGGMRKIRTRLFRGRAARALGGVICMVIALGLAAGGMVLSVSAAVRDKAGSRIWSAQELAASGRQYDCVLVLGCRVYDNGELSSMLEDRMLTGVELVHAGVSDTLLVSGDHRTDAYNEVDAMKRFAVEHGVPSERVFQDHDGYSTYDSISRLKKIYGAGRVVIVTQEYHLYRALYLAEKLGMEAVGVAADRQSYQKQSFRDVREVLARCKDVFFGLKQPLPEVMGSPVDLSGNGDGTAQSRPHSQ